MHRKPTVAALGLCSALLLVTGCETGSAPNAGKGPAGKGEPLPLARIEAAALKVEPIPWPRLTRVQGSFVADEEAVIGAKVPGRVANVHVDLGQLVTAGTELISLDREDLRLEIEQAEAQLEQARAAVGLAKGASVDDLSPTNAPPVREAQAVLEEAQTQRARADRLAKGNAITETELQQALAAEKVAAAQLASATNAVNEKIAVIRVRAAELALATQRYNDAAMPAPFDGLVLERHIGPGSFVQTGQAVVTLVRTNPLRFQGSLPERFAREAAIGQEVRLHVDRADVPRCAEVTRISPALDPNSRALMFEADVDNTDGRLRAGLFAEADVVLDSEQTAVAVPEGAISEFAGAEKVWKVIDGKSVEQKVTTGGRREGLIEIVDGLNSGDVILADGLAGRPAEVTITSTTTVTPPESDHPPAADDVSTADAPAGEQVGNDTSPTAGP